MFDDVLQPIKDRLVDHEARLGRVPDVSWMTVSSVSPLRVTPDGPSGEVPVSPDVYGAVPGLGDRVLVLRSGSRLTVLPAGGSGGGGGSALERVAVPLVGASGNTSVDVGADEFSLVSVQASGATRVRAYRSTADRSADAIRPLGVRPPVQGRVLFEFNFQGANTYHSTGYKCFLPASTTTLYLAVSAAADLTFNIER